MRTLQPELLDWRRTIGAVGLSLLLSALATGDDTRGPAAAEVTSKGVSYVMRTALLIREDAVRQELAISGGQAQELTRLCQDVDGVLFALRDASPDELEGAFAEQYERIRRHADAAPACLNESQRKRLSGIVLQSLGPAALAQKEWTKGLALTVQQDNDIRRINESLEKKLGNGGGDAGDRRRMRQDAQTAVLDVLTNEQKRLWRDLLGEPFSFSKLEPAAFLAPELQGNGSEWINGGPQSLRELRGQVVVVHFYTFGCVNCQRNYRWYKEWQQQYAGRGVTLIGIHTPETAGERYAAKVLAAAKEAGLEFPILIDNDKANWRAWGNRMWPSVYVIDKRGRIRQWWYGELDWQGKGGQRVIRSTIEQLRDEDTTQQEGNGAHY